MKTLRTGLLWLGIYLFLSVLPVSAASLRFDQISVSGTVGQTFQLQAIVDAGTDQITSTDMWILYDQTLLEAQAVTAGTFFPAVTNNITAGKIYIAGLITDPGSYKTGSGTVATITFRPLKNGTGTVSYDCRLDASNSSKVIKNTIDSPNVIVCSQNGSSAITIGSVLGAQPTVAPTYIAQQQPTALPQTGIADQMPRIAVMGGFLLLAGFVLRVVLLAL